MKTIELFLEHQLQGQLMTKKCFNFKRKYKTELEKKVNIKEHSLKYNKNVKI